MGELAETEEYYQQNSKVAFITHLNQLANKSSHEESFKDLIKKYEKADVIKSEPQFLNPTHQQIWSMLEQARSDGQITDACVADLLRFK